MCLSLGSPENIGWEKDLQSGSLLKRWNQVQEGGESETEKLEKPTVLLLWETGALFHWNLLRSVQNIFQKDWSLQHLSIAVHPSFWLKVDCRNINSPVLLGDGYTRAECFPATLEKFWGQNKGIYRGCLKDNADDRGWVWAYLELSFVAMATVSNGSGGCDAVPFHYFFFVLYFSVFHNEH